VVAINFSAPLWSALLSVLWLRERAGLTRWIALLAGFAGVLIVTNPGADSLQLGALFALSNAVMYGSVTVAVRGMTATESTDTLLMWQMVTIAGFHTLLLLFGFRWPTPLDAIMLIAGGVANAAAQYLWTWALHLAPATAVSPFFYLTLVWVMAIGYLVWGMSQQWGFLSVRRWSSRPASSCYGTRHGGATPLPTRPRGRSGTYRSMAPRTGREGNHFARTCRFGTSGSGPTLPTWARAASRLLSGVHLSCCQRSRKGRPEPHKSTCGVSAINTLPRPARRRLYCCQASFAAAASASSRNRSSFFL
jgi:uncharacterized membrane protein